MKPIQNALRWITAPITAILATLFFLAFATYPHYAAYVLEGLLSILLPTAILFAAIYPFTLRQFLKRS